MSGRPLGSALHWAQNRKVSSIFWNISWGHRNPKPDTGVPPSTTNLQRQWRSGNREKEYLQYLSCSPSCLLYISNYSCYRLLPPFLIQANFISSIGIKLAKVRMRKSFNRSTPYCPNYTPTPPSVITFMKDILLPWRCSLTCILHSFSCSAFEGSAAKGQEHYSPKRRSQVHLY